MHLPAPFLPLGDGSTAASRLAAQFRAMGYNVALTAGPLGYRYRDCQPRHEFWDRGKTSEETACLIGVDPDASPWTDALHRYIRKLGTMIVQPDPGWKSKHDSYCMAIDILESGYDRVVLARGDKLYQSAFLENVLSAMPWPCQFSLDVYHSIFMLDRKGVGVYRADAQNHRQRSKALQNWGQEMSKQPDGGEGTGRLDRAGIKHYSWHMPPWDHVDRYSLWADVDCPQGYADAICRVSEGRI